MGKKGQKTLLYNGGCGKVFYGFLEYPQFLTLETGRMPDSIGQDAFSEVK